MEIQIILALAALGCCTGFLAGLLGIGGGMVLTPFLTLLLGYAGIPIEHIVHVAIATSMGTILFTSLSSVRAHAKRGAVLDQNYRPDGDGYLFHCEIKDRQGVQAFSSVLSWGLKFPARCRPSGLRSFLPCLSTLLPQKCSSMPNPRLRAICPDLQACLVPVQLSA